MAVPGRRNGLMEEDEEDQVGQEVLYEDEEEQLVDEFGMGPHPHLRALTEAAQRGNVDALRLALENLNNGSINDPVEDGDTVLHLSCLYGYKSCVQLLLERGASLEARDEEGAIPLHDACAGGFTEIVQLLIDAGDSDSPDCVKQMLDTVDADGDTPLHHAARGEHLDVVRLLLTAGANPRSANIYGKTPAELSEPETEVRSVLEAATNAAVVMACQ